jgi:hypothetical protein
MKKVFSVTAILLVTAITTTNAASVNDRTNIKQVNRVEKYAGGVNQVAVSDFTKNQFAIDFPKATNVHFTAKSNGFDEVSFTLGGKEIKAYYDDNSELIGSSQNQAFTDLPADAQTKILENYPGYTVAGVVRFDANENNDNYQENNVTYMTLYGSTFENDDNYFVELQNANKAIVVKADLSGDINFYTTMK